MKVDHYAVTWLDIYDCVYGTNGGDPLGRVWKEKVPDYGSSKKCITRDEVLAHIYVNDLAFNGEDNNQLVTWDDLQPMNVRVRAKLGATAGPTEVVLPDTYTLGVTQLDTFGLIVSQGYLDPSGSPFGEITVLDGSTGFNIRFNASISSYPTNSPTYTFYDIPYNINLAVQDVYITIYVDSNGNFQN